MQKKEFFLSKTKGGLIVSCQALETEPLHSSYIMSRMAYAAKLGGACGIRANSVEDIRAIRATVDLPMIGIIKQEIASSPVYITPTEASVGYLVECGVEVIALDATCRPRPDGRSLDEFFAVLRKRYSDQPFMADCSTYEEGIHAREIGFDLVGTTLCGYTDYTKGTSLPDFELIARLGADLHLPLIAEGGIWSPEALKKVLSTPGVHAAVIGSAITRPMEITRHFVAAAREARAEQEGV